MTYFPVWKYDFNIRSRKPTVLPCGEYGTSASGGASFPLTNLIKKMMLQRPQHAVWYSLPNGCDLRAENIHPGHVHLLCQMDMLSSRHTHVATKRLAVFSFQAQIICLTCQNLS